MDVTAVLTPEEIRWAGEFPFGPDYWHSKPREPQPFRGAPKKSDDAQCVFFFGDFHVINFNQTSHKEIAKNYLISVYICLACHPASCMFKPSKPQDREAMDEENLQNRRDDKESDARSASSTSPKQLSVPAKKKHRYPNWLMADHDLPWLLGKINEFVVILEHHRRHIYLHSSL